MGFGFLISLGELALGVWKAIKGFFPSSDRLLGRAEQSNKDSAAAQAAERIKDETPMDTSAATDDKLRRGKF